MVRDLTFNQAIQSLRNELRLSSNTSKGIDHLEYLKEVLLRNQEILWDENDWGFKKVLRENATKDLSAGQRYYDFPATMDLEDTVTVWEQQANNDVWVELVFGIGPAEYSIHDSDNDERADPALKWDFRDGDQLEIWPIPASNSGKMRAEGSRMLIQPVELADKMELDLRLVVLWAAAEIAAAYSYKDADAKLVAAQRRLISLKTRSRTKRKTAIGENEYDPLQSDSINRLPNGTRILAAVRDIS